MNEDGKGSGKGIEDNAKDDVRILTGTSASPPPPPRQSPFCLSIDRVWVIAAGRTRHIWHYFLEVLRGDGRAGCRSVGRPGRDQSGKNLLENLGAREGRKYVCPSLTGQGKARQANERANA